MYQEFTQRELYKIVCLWLLVTNNLVYQNIFPYKYIYKPESLYSNEVGIPSTRAVWNVLTTQPRQEKGDLFKIQLTA
jgi:hypothetical protein